MVSRPPALTTRVLLICAAIGVATGLLSVFLGYISGPVWIVAPVLYGVVLGAHVLPGIIAQALLRLPLVALTTHVLAALVSSAFAPQWIGRYILTALLIGGVQEGVTALTRYKHWEGWRFFLSAVVIGIVLAIVMGIALDADKLPLWGSIVFYVVLVVSPAIWTAIGLAIGSSLRRAGVARTAGN